MINFIGFSEFFLQNPICLLVLLAHVLVDFQFQSQKLADLKVKKFSFLIRHLIIVILPLIVLAILIPKGLLFFSLVGVSHIVIDFLKYVVNPLVVKRHCEKAIFLFDQFLHIACIFAFYFLFGQFKYPNWVNEGYSIYQILLLFAITGKPVNILFKLFFSKYQSQDMGEETVAGAGAMIGILERLIMAISLVFGQFTAIGLVFTAKSIARYNKISESQSFAEYYLIGSLFSMISVLLTYGIFYW